MKNNLFRLTLIAITLAAAIVVFKPATTAQAATATDGRINNQVWVNGWGAVVAYCADANGVPGDYGVKGIRILNQNGVIQLVAVPADIIAARDLANKNNTTVKIKTQGLYTLSVGPNVKFTITSTPDYEHKTFLGSWTGCTPVSYPTLTITATPIIPLV